jgi:hypothetical protein
MKKAMKTRRLLLGLAGAGCAVGIALPWPASAEVSDADFNALKEAVQKLSEQVQSLQQTNTAEQQLHEKDMQQLKELQDKLSQTQQMATNAVQASIAAQTPPQEPLDEASVNHNFMILGDAEVTYSKVTGQNGGFALADFAPIFLYRAGDNILFESGWDTALSDNAPGAAGYTTTFTCTYAQIDYLMNDYVTLSAGEMLAPLGTYNERSAGWLNKFPDDPLDVDALLPGNCVGAQLRGAVPLGDSGKTITYTVYGVNGPSSSDINPNLLGAAGNLDLTGNVGPVNLHSDPSGGARLGVFLPFPYKPHYDLELDISGQSGQWNDTGTHLWSAGVLDAALHLGPNFEAKANYILTRYGSDDLGEVTQHGWYAQDSYKLAGLNLELPFINNMELVGRYDSLVNAYDPSDTDNNGFYSTHRWSAGFIYYFTNTLLFETDYEFWHSTDPAQPSQQLICQLSLGF